ncbi:MAG: hypothetical protein CMK85_03740 [Pseudomonadales bacterium]|nr:hypothetical protein [Pseudomonadales bacterium]
MGAVLVAIVVLVLVGWGVSVHYRRRRERKALLSVLAQIRVLRQLVEQVQRHRGLSYGVMSGERSLEARRWSVHQQVNQLFETCQLYQPSLHWHGSWHDALACWTQLKEGREEQDPESMLLIHNEMIRNLLATVQGLAERHDLVCLGRLAPQADGLWLELLRNTEIVGQSRAIGTGIAANRQNQAGARAKLAALAAQLREQCYAVLARLASDPELRSLVDHPVRAAEDALDVLLERISALLDSPEPGIDSAGYFQTATQALSAQLLLVDMLLARLERRALSSD